MNCNNKKMDIIDKKLFGKRIKELRKAKNMTQEVLAESVEVDAKHLSRIESGKNLPSLILLKKISGVLDIPMDKFFNFEHLRSKEELIKDITKKLDVCSEENLRLLFKLIHEIVD